MSENQNSFPQTSAIYADEKDVFGTLMSAMQELLATRPAEPIPMLRRYFLRKSRLIIRVSVTGLPYSSCHALARRIADTYDLPLINPDVLIETAEPQLQQLVERYRKKQRALPPGLAFSLLRQQIFSQDCADKGWVLCGFPETRAQDDLFRNRAICAQKTIILNVSPETAAERCTNSRYDPITKITYDVKSDLPAEAEVHERLVAQPCDASDAASLTARNFAYESIVLRRSLEELSQEDPCCVVLDGDKPMDTLVQEALQFVSIRPIQYRPYMHRVLFVGRPGSGKKTMADQLAEHLRLCHVSSGNMVMRAATNPENSNFREVNMFFSRERQIPDDIVAGMVLEQLRASELQGFILRGFPRSCIQADLLSQFGFQPSKVFFFNLPEDAATERLVVRGRELFEKSQGLKEICTNTSGETTRFSCFTTSKIPGVQGEDTQLETIQEQNKIFTEHEPKLREFYKDVLYDIDASLPESDVYGQIKYHLLHPRPLRPVEKPLPVEEDPFALMSEEMDVELGVQTLVEQA